VFDIEHKEITVGELTFDCTVAGRGNNVALLLHGFPECRLAWRFQIDLLAAMGWRVVAPDLRGYGHSSRPRPDAPYKVDRLVKDVTNLFDTLGAEKRLLIGHDWGAMVAWVYAMEGPRELDGLIIMNVAHPTAYARAFSHPTIQWLRSWYIELFRLPWIPERLLTLGRAWAIGALIVFSARRKENFTRDVIDEYRSNALIPGAIKAMLGSYRANKDLTDRFAVPPKKICVPTLMVWGEDDVFIDIEFTENYGNLVADLTLKLLPGVGHWVQQEAPERVNSILKRWLQARVNLRLG
jgi:pimeloyl-ACP methyl ester carboxylesterase